MTNMNLIEQAVQLAVNYFEANQISVNSNSIRHRVLEWYNYSDIADAETLAAAAIESEYDCGADYDTILEWKDYYFPEIPVEYSGNISVYDLVGC